MNIQDLAGRMTEDETREMTRRCLDNLGDEDALWVIQNWAEDNNLTEESMAIWEAE